MRFRTWLPAASRLALVYSSMAAATLGGATPPTRVDLTVAGRSNATPSIAADGDVVAVAWGASLASGATDVFVAVSRDGGRAFSAPTRVNDVDGDARLNGEQPPRVALFHNTITVVWTTKGTNGTRLVQSRSSDGGRTFAKATVVPGSDASGNRGWENAAADRGGRVFAVWLDHRELAKQDGEVAATHHDHAAMSAGRPDGVAAAQKSKLYIASLDGAVAPIAVTGGVCYCCKTAIAASADGALYAAWRHVFPGNIRDIAFTLSRDGGRTFGPPVRVSEDKWVLEGCPDDGPAMAIDASNRIHIVWPTLVMESTPEGAERAEKTGSPRSPRALRSTADEQTIALFYATSTDGKRFTPRERIPTQGTPHHPQIAIGADGGPVIAWDEAANGTRVAAMTRVPPGGQGRARFAREVVGDAAVYPVVARSNGATILAWTSGASPASVIRVEARP